MTNTNTDKIDPTTKQLLIAAQDEGIGSIYERVMLQDLLPSILSKTDAKSILEFPATITKGWDNHVLLDSHDVTVADLDGSLKKKWPFEKKPRFEKVSKDSQRFDLVWNFALFHQHQKLFPAIDMFSKKYILLFTPNIFNWGAPIHWGFHLVTLTGCNHPENGPVNLMTANGLANYVEDKGYTVLETGYFDLPPWPDFAFSKKELGKHFPFSLLWGEKEKNSAELKNKSDSDFDPVATNKVVQKSAYWERKGVPCWVESIVAHHQYVLAEKL